MFSGTTYNPVLDGPRLKRQLDLVFDKMIDGRWHTLTELAECSGGTDLSEDEYEYRLVVRPRFKVTQEYLKQKLHYDETTGLFTWLLPAGRAPAGALAGHVTKTGYVTIRLAKKNYSAHRLAWLYVYGKYPEFDIDHINGNSLDNRLANLRDVPRADNLHNIFSPQTINKTSGSRGVRKRGDSYSARIKVSGKTMNLGSFENERDAAIAYLRAKRDLQNSPPERVEDALRQLGFSG